MAVDMSIVVKDKAYFEKINALTKIKKQIIQDNDIDLKLKHILHSDVSKISRSSSSQNQFVQVNKDQNNFCTSQFFSGKLYISWLFILKNIPVKTNQKFKKMKKLLRDKLNVFPFAQTFKDSLKYFEAPYTYFKLLIDLENAEELVEHLKKNESFLDKIAEIHIYSPNLDGKVRYDNIRSNIKNPKKVSQLLYEIDCQLDDIQTYLLNCRQFRFQDGTIKPMINGHHFRNMLPGYMKLSGQDKTQVTKYRMNLYRWINIKNESQQEEMTKIFQKFVRGVYASQQGYMALLNEYIKMKKGKQFGHKQALKYYSRQTFYYKVTNAMLRVSRQIQDFKLIATPFNEVYKAIKYFYQNDKQKLYKNRTQGFSLYRGTIFNIKKLKVGQYIELLGFTSTSKNIEIAKTFLPENINEGCLMEIRIPSHVFNLKQRNQDHGFVDFNQNANSNFPNEKQVLINALNILKVVEIISKKDSDENVDQIVLQYGAIFQLQQKKKDNLSLSERQVMANFQYCYQQMAEIKDEVDLLILNQEYDQASRILKKKIQEEKECTEEMQIKYAQVLYETGEKTKSSIIARQVLNKVLQTEESLEKHAQRIIQILKVDDDNVSVKKIILKQIENLDKNRNSLKFQKVKKFYEVGQLSFEQGNIKQSEEILKESLKLIDDQILNGKNKGTWKKNSKQTDYELLKLYEFKLKILIFMMKVYSHIGDFKKCLQFHKQGLNTYGEYYDFVLKDSQKSGHFEQNQGQTQQILTEQKRYEYH